jgi:hypothetical protein
VFFILVKRGPRKAAPGREGESILEGRADTSFTIPHFFPVVFLHRGVLRLRLMLRGLSGRTDDVSCDDHP